MPFENIRHAFVVGSAADFAAVHRWTATTRLNPHVTSSPFRDLDRALAWLGIAPDYRFN